MPIEDNEALIQRAQLDAPAYGGHCTFPFCQSTPPFGNLIATNPVAARGICQALVNRWIVDHANGGSIWNRLYPSGAAHSARGPTKLPECWEVWLLILAQTGVFTLPQQRLFTERWLACQGVVPLEHIVTREYSVSGHFDTVREACKALIDAVDRSQSTDGHYLVVGMERGAPQTGGHAVGVFVGMKSHSGGTDLLYFDPNIGECWFPDRSRFREWMVKTWFSLRKSYDFSGFYITAFAKKGCGS